MSCLHMHCHSYTYSCCGFWHSHPYIFQHLKKCFYYLLKMVCYKHSTNMILFTENDLCMYGNLHSFSAVECFLPTCLPYTEVILHLWSLLGTFTMHFNFADTTTQSPQETLISLLCLHFVTRLTCAFIFFCKVPVHAYCNDKAWQGYFEAST